MARHDEGFFSAKDNLRLFWESDIPENPKAHIAVIHGYMDHAGRYRRVIDALVKDGFAVHALDYRGHGQSDGRRSHTDRFSDYEEDVQLFWSRVRQAAGDKKCFMLAHSFGALIAVHNFSKHPDGMAGLVITSPFFAFAFKPPVIKVQVSKLVGKFIPWLPIKNPLKPSDLTRDPVLQKEVERDPLYNRVVTPRWFTEAVKAHGTVMGTGKNLKFPMFVLVGANDPVALPAAMRKFFESVVSSDKKLKEYPGMVHEVMNDVGKEEVWSDISNWISAHL
jgi:lysophospholipase